MKTVKIIIERSEDMFSAFAENVQGIYAGGNTVDEVKQSVLDSIRLLKEFNSPNNIPDILKGEYEIVYHFDTVSLLSYYKGIFTNSALEKLTGINQKQIQHYATGHRKPRAEQREKIETALHALGRELLAVEL
ncbi:MAG: type II toxin-antitoxin system HicB family antitoxin [Flavobacterium lindanitolerans]|uniref:type II toxin-antitoxin system HicB family antitoxin n=1 Tax=Flavobacterium lindanitolerans TaxID=428988 RepID=UPI001A54083F|nr:type II toxin-antitoxin system HicB family antitoxin [Flavobacterium lindanitolerans]MBL7866623.1 type II toxin-antitoxin system HicB family antitoxin [Flavobacterium lindanitolerans]